jgi:tRNA-dihydrouridine synthase B
MDAVTGCPIGPLRLGTLELPMPVLAAPIAGFTDAIFRRMVRAFGGCGLLFTEMVGAAGWVQSGMLPDRLAGVADEPRPLGVQLWDRDEQMMYEAARRLSALHVSVIDLNCGCPKRRIMGRMAAGASLLRDPATVGRLVAAAVRGAEGIPVTVKIRLGPSVAARTAVAVACSAEDHGAAAVTVHGRTADENYDVPSRLDLIAEVVDAVAIPVIANGDVHDAGSALHALRTAGAAGVMVARAAVARPWVFREIAAALRGETLPPAPSRDEQRHLLLRHHAEMVAQHGDPWGTIYMRKFACRYVLGVPGTRAFREAANRARNAVEFRAAVHQFFPLKACGATPP